MGDPPKRDPNAEAKTEFVLIDDQGKEKKLRLDAEKAKTVGGPRAFNGKRVKVKGNRISNGEAVLEVQQIDFERPEDAAEARSRLDTGSQPTAQALATGGSTNKPWVTIGCSFGDSPNPDSSKRGYFEDLMGVTYDPNTGTASMADKAPGLDHYWKEVSFGMMTLGDSQVGMGNQQGSSGRGCPGSKPTI